MASKNSPKATLAGNLTFADFKVRYDENRKLHFSHEALNTLIDANLPGFPRPPMEELDPLAVFSWLAGLYLVHCRNGGEEDPVGEELIREFRAITGKRSIN